MRDFLQQIEDMRRRQEHISEEIRALRLVAQRDGLRIQALLQIAEQRLKTLETRRK